MRGHKSSTTSRPAPAGNPTSSGQARLFPLSLFALLENLTFPCSASQSDWQRLTARVAPLISDVRAGGNCGTHLNLCQGEEAFVWKRAHPASAEPGRASAHHLRGLAPAFPPGTRRGTRSPAWSCSRRPSEKRSSPDHPVLLPPEPLPTLHALNPKKQIVALHTDSPNLPLPSPLAERASAQHLQTQGRSPPRGRARRGKGAGGGAEVVPTAGNFALQEGALPICSSKRVRRGPGAGTRCPTGGSSAPALRHSCRAEPKGTQLLETLRRSRQQLLMLQEKGPGWEKGSEARWSKSFPGGHLPPCHPFPSSRVTQEGTGRRRRVKSLISIPAAQEVLPVPVSEWTHPQHHRCPGATEGFTMSHRAWSPGQRLLVQQQNTRLLTCEDRSKGTHGAVGPFPSTGASSVPAFPRGGGGGVHTRVARTQAGWGHLHPGGMWEGVVPLQVPCLLLHMGRMQAPNSSWKGGWRRMGRSSRNLTGSGRVSSHPSVTFAIVPPSPSLSLPYTLQTRSSF